MDYSTDMKAANLKFNLIDSYLGLLENLSPDNKLELISKLSDSLKSSKKQTDRSLDDLCGAFIFDKSSDDLIRELKSGRNFNRKIKAF
jgi:hypothetical protein